VDDAPAAPLSPGRAGRALRLLGLPAAALVIVSFHAAARDYYSGFRVPQGLGMDSMLPEELAHYLLFFVYGSVATVLLTIGLLATPLPDRVISAFRLLARRRPVALALVVAVGVAVACWLLKTRAMDGGVLTDDEHVYSFIAQTLRTGSVTAPSMKGDYEFFSEQFVVHNDHVRFGKYPIGHPLFLAVGQALGAEDAVVPILTGVLALLVAWIGLMEFSAPIACLSLAFFAISPQVLLTGATKLSQPTCAVCLLGAIGCLFRLARAEGPAWGWSAAAGALLGLGVLIRPLPGILFVLAAAAYVAFGTRAGFRRAPSLADWIALALPIAVLGQTLLWINGVQTGHALTTGYHVAHPDLGRFLVLQGRLSMWGLSLASAAVRLNFWLLGFPLSLIFCIFARCRPVTVLLWSMVGAEFGYRLLAPKAGVGTTGPIYLFEVAPLLCLLSADGVARLVAAREASAGPILRTQTVAALLVSGAVMNATLFTPFKVADAERSGRAQQMVFREIEKRGIKNALIFHVGTVPYFTGLSWAYYPPPNAPSMDGNVLFAMYQAEGPAERNVEFWKRRFPDRQAYLFGWSGSRGPFLMPLEAYVALQKASRAPVLRKGLQSGVAASTPGGS